MCIYDKVYDGTDTLTLPPFEIFGFATVPDARPQKFGAACGVHLCASLVFVLWLKKVTILFSKRVRGSENSVNSKTHNFVYGGPAVNEVKKLQ